MPPGITFDQEKVLNAGFKILREEGIDHLTARNIARRIGCSTQPVYSVFGSMEKLRVAVIKRAKEFTINYLLKNSDPGSEFYSAGMQYFHFAREEKILFKFLLGDGQLGLTMESMSEFSAPLIARMKEDPFLTDLNENQLGRIGRDLWIYCHGLVASTYESDRSDIEDIVRERMYLMGKTVIEWEHQQKHE